MQITGAIFDMDGTLIDSLMFWDVLWKRLGIAYRQNPNFRPDAMTEKEIRTLPLREGMHLLHQRCGLGADGDVLWQMADTMCAQFYAEEVQLKPGVLPFLQYCRQKGIRMCICSATDRALLNIVIRKFRLDDYLPMVFSCSEIGKGKEAPDIFLQAHAAIGTPKVSTWVFEDSITALQTAQIAGFKTVGVYDAYGFSEEQVKQYATVYIDRAETLERLIAKIE